MVARKWTERRLRDHLWSHRQRFRDLMEPLPAELRETPTFDISTLTPTQLLQSLTFRRLVDVYDQVASLILLGREVRLAPIGRSGMYVDLFGISLEAGLPALGVLELKASRHAARESFTELLGYGQGLLLTFPGLCRDDLLHVLVAPMSRVPAVVHRALAASWVLDRRRVLALEPIFDTPRQGELRLRPWVPKLEDFAPLGQAAFREENLSVSVQVWTGGKKAWPRVSMDHIAARAAVRMEASGIHGFAFAARAYPELRMTLPNSLTCVGLNPFSVAGDLYPRRHAVPKTIAFDQIGLLDLRLSDVLPSLERSEEAGSFADSVDFARSTWPAHLTAIAYETVKHAVKKPRGASVNTDHGHFDWSSYLYDSQETLAHQFAVMPTGLMRELFDEVVELDYREFVERGEHPLFGDDLPEHAAAMSQSHYYFRAFLSRMMQEGGLL